ncbi:hypothetical protein DMUE_6341, partial [Dictyocoela muelleri]
KCNKKEISIRRSSAFSKIKLPLKSIIRIIYLWAQNNTIKTIKKEIKIGNDAISAVLELINKKTKPAEIKQICGFNRTVEVDKSAFTKRKYGKGRLVKTLWCISGICRETRECFFELSESRSSEKIHEVLKKYIKKDTHIISDV